MVQTNDEDFTNNVYSHGINNNDSTCIQTSNGTISVLGQLHPGYSNMFKNIVGTTTSAPTITYTNGQQLLVAPASLFHAPISPKHEVYPRKEVRNKREMELKHQIDSTNVMRAYSLPSTKDIIKNEPEPRYSPEHNPSTATSNSSLSDLQSNSGITIHPMCQLLSIGLNLAVSRSQLMNLVTPQETTCRISRQDSNFIYISIPELAIELPINNIT